MHLGFTVQAADISIHALREEGDSKMYGRTVNDNDFYPRPPRGGRRPSSTTPISSANFYPRPPRGGRHPGGVGLLRGQNFYPRPPRGGRLFEVILMEAGHGISIHALREEGDSVGPSTSPSATYFYPRPPRGGRLEMGCGKTLTANFYPRPPRGGRPPRNRCRRRVNRISIHALREEGDLVLLGEQRVFTSISIHALREEGDHPPRRSSRCKPISIHALREEGDILHSAGVASLQIFLSTPSARRATVVVLRVVGCQFGFLSTPSARRATWRPRVLSGSG